MSVDLKAATPDSTITASSFLFGADSQSAGQPSVYDIDTTFMNYIRAKAITWTGHATMTAGLEAYRADSAGVVIGYNAGTSDTSDSIDIGFSAGEVASGFTNVRVGRHAGYQAGGDNAVMIGHAAGQYGYDAGNSVFIGHYAGRNPSQTAGVHSFSAVMIGDQAGFNGVTVQSSVMIGATAGQSATTADSSVMIGYGAGSGATNASNSILIGKSAGASLSRSNTLVIEGISGYGDAGTTGLIYGEFDNRILTINGILRSTSQIGYATGAGGTVTQGTSRTAGVTLNKASGAITLFTAAGSATPASFTVTNSTVAATDTISLSVESGTNTYAAMVTAVGSGSFQITFWSLSGTASDAPVINFNVVKGVTS